MDILRERSRSLSAITSMDEGQVQDLLLYSLRSFSLPETSENIDMVARVLEEAFRRSPWPLPSLRLALELTAFHAHRAGLLFYELIALLISLAASGFTATRAGAALQAVLSTVTLEEIAPGGLKPLLQAFSRLSGGNAYHIFGTPGARVAIILGKRRAEILQLCEALRKGR